MRRTRIEHMLSAYHPIATNERTSWKVSKVPGRDIAVMDLFCQTGLTWQRPCILATRDRGAVMLTPYAPKRKPTSPQL